VTLYQSIRPVALTHQISTTAFLHQKENNPGNPSALHPIFFAKEREREREREREMVCRHNNTLEIG
jgi:hypothetical protein